MRSSPAFSKLLAVLAVSLAAASQAAADECTPGFQPQMTAPLPQKPDQALFSVAVQIAGNAVRCRNGRAALRHDTRLRKAAFVHSRNMARTGVFDHRSRVRGAATLKDRMKLAGVRWRAIAENIALFPRYRFASRTPFVVDDRAACRFRDPKTGTLIAVHSYASLAQAAVDGWMNSPGHRKNLLSRRMGRVGAALIFAPNDTCGRFYITQVFAN